MKTGHIAGKLTMLTRLDEQVIAPSDLVWPARVQRLLQLLQQLFMSLRDR
mgnify:CR=1 FL=1